MEQNLIRKNMWNGAAKAGLALGAVSSAYLFINQFIGTAGLPAFVTTLVNGIFWVAKFGGCIWLMAFFMKKFAQENPQADNSTTMKFGTASALLSALVYAAVTFANVSFISADLFAEQFDIVMQQMAPMMDSNTMDAVDGMMEMMPEITFFSNLIYCFIYGALLSVILSRNIPSKDPFANYKPDEQ